MVDRDVPSRLLSSTKGTRLVLRRDAEALRPGDTVKSAGALWRVQGRIARSGDVVLEPADKAL